jgi:hypothetical protein
MKVSWDDDIPNMVGKIKFMFQTTNQNSVATTNPDRIHEPECIFYERMTR